MLAVLQSRSEIAQKYFFSKCYICERKFGKYFQYHHLWYEPNEKKYSDFPDSNLYWEYVCEKIIENPERFLLLCRICHSRIDRKRGGLSRMKADKVVRLFLATLSTILAKQKNDKKIHQSTQKNNK